MTARFWSLCRSGLTPVEGKPSFRAFCAAVRSCGLPRPFVRMTFDRTHRFLEAGVEFYSGDLFRCWFLVRSSALMAR